MSQHRRPFKTPLVRIKGTMSRRYQPGNAASEDRAVEEVLDAPEMQLLSDMLAPAISTGKRGRGRPSKFDARFYLVWMVVALVLALDARGARNRLLTSNQLRARVGLPPLTAKRAAELAEMTDGDIDDLDAPSPARCRDFVREMVQDGGRFETFIPTVRRAMLMVAGAAIDDHNLRVDWVGGDGKRVMAATTKVDGPRADSGTAIWSRDGEAAFNLRHHFHVTAGTGAPLIFVSHLCPPDAEINTLEDEVLPALAEASDFLSNFITERRLARGLTGDEVQHPGLRRAAFASDTVLQSARGLRSIRMTGLWAAARKPDFNPQRTGKTITVVHAGRHVALELRTDGSFMCPDCSSTEPMQQLAGDYGKNVYVRCGNAACDNRLPIWVPLCGPDRNDYLPTSSASRGEANAAAINELPTWDERYIALRHLTLNTVEWTHMQLERLFKLGSKNRGLDRRKTTGHEANVVWWALGSLVWNITVRLNLDTGRYTTETLDLAEAVANARKRDGQVKDKRQSKRNRRRATAEQTANKEIQRRLKAIEKQLRSAATDGTPVDPAALTAALATGVA